MNNYVKFDVYATHVAKVAGMPIPSYRTPRIGRRATPPSTYAIMDKVKKARQVSGLRLTFNYDGYSW